MPRPRRSRPTARLLYTQSEPVGCLADPHLSRSASLHRGSFPRHAGNRLVPNHSSSGRTAIRCSRRFLMRVWRSEARYLSRIRSGKGVWAAAGIAACASSCPTLPQAEGGKRLGLGLVGATERDLIGALLWRHGPRWQRDHPTRLGQVSPLSGC